MIAENVLALYCVIERKWDEYMRQARFVLIDDIDGSNAQETVNFAVGRQQYEIVLNAKHVEEFNADMARWIKGARRVSQRRSQKTPTVTIANDASLIRAWATERGIELSGRGRIPAIIREQYYAEVGKSE